MDIPTDWEYCVDSTYYRIYKRFGYVMMWNNSHWMRSGKDESDLTPKKKVACKRQPRNPVAEETKKGRVLKAVFDKGARTTQELQVDTRLNKSSLRYACTSYTGRAGRADCQAAIRGS